MVFFSLTIKALNKRPLCPFLECLMIILRRNTGWKPGATGESEETGSALTEEVAQELTKQQDHVGSPDSHSVLHLYWFCVWLAGGAVLLRVHPGYVLTEGLCSKLFISCSKGLWPVVCNDIRHRFESSIVMANDFKLCTYPAAQWPHWSSLGFFSKFLPPFIFSMELCVSNFDLDVSFLNVSDPICSPIFWFAFGISNSSQNYFIKRPICLLIEHLKIIFKQNFLA